jgi:hypothetical protein
MSLGVDRTILHQSIAIVKESKIGVAFKFDGEPLQAALDLTRIEDTEKAARRATMRVLPEISLCIFVFISFPTDKVIALLPMNSGKRANKISSERARRFMFSVHYS